ncbi:Guanylate cyclase soluble subunit beta-1, partial [Fragariocoptes setiger]
MIDYRYLCNCVSILIFTFYVIKKDEACGAVSYLVGEKLFELVQAKGYGKILRILGGTPKEFFDNLDALHDHLYTFYPAMEAPSFRCTYEQPANSTDDTPVEEVTLHYYNNKHGLEGIVRGAITAAIRELFRVRVQVDIMSVVAHVGGDDQQHVQFKITMLGSYGASNDRVPVKSLVPCDTFTYRQVPQLNANFGINRISPLIFCQALPFHLVFDRSMRIHQAGTSIMRVLPSLDVPGRKLTHVLQVLRPKNMKLTFDSILAHINSVFVLTPIVTDSYHTDSTAIANTNDHLMCDSKPSDRQNRSSVRLYNQLLRRCLSVNAASDQFEQQTDTTNNNNNEQHQQRQHRHPSVTFQNKEKSLSECSGICQPSYLYDNPDKAIMRLKGQMIYMPANDMILYLCSPSVISLNDLNDVNLYLSDIPLHDATRDIVLLSEQFQAEYKLTKNLELLTEQLHSIYEQLEVEKAKTDRLLYSVLPPSVAEELRQHRPVPAKRFTEVTILFSGIVGFNEFCSRNSDSRGAIRIVNLLNKIYTTFDCLTEPERNPHVYKVETVGDKYMAVSGLPEPCTSHARCINNLALDIMDLCKTIRMADYDEGSGTYYYEDEPDARQQHLRITIGIHCGEVVTGVIGKRTPRYCLFGNTVNLTSRCETTGLKGAINVSDDVYRLCMSGDNYDPNFNFHYRGEITMKGRSAPMKMWYLTRRDPSS